MFSSFSEINAGALQLGHQLADDADVRRGDNEGVGGDARDLSADGISHAGEKVHETPGDVLRGGLQIDEHGALIAQVVGDLRRGLEAFGLDEHDLRLSAAGGGV